MRIAEISSTGTCGIAVYADRLTGLLREAGHDILRLDVRAEMKQLVREVLEWAPDVVHLHFEPSFLGSVGRFAILLDKLQGFRRAVTLHYADEACWGLLQSRCEIGITHKPMETPGGRQEVLHMPCPMYEPGDHEPGVPPLAVTFGFLSTWKKQAAVLEAMVPRIKQGVYRVLMLCASHGSMGSDSAHVAGEIRDIIQDRDLGDRAALVTDFLDEADLLARMAAADLGFLFAPQDTCSGSAAAREFIAAGLPFVVSESTHFWGLESAVRSNQTVGDFAETVAHLADSPLWRSRVRARVLAEYARTNWRVATQRHLELFDES